MVLLHRKQQLQAIKRAVLQGLQGGDIHAVGLTNMVLVKMNSQPYQVTL